MIILTSCLKWCVFVSYDGFTCGESHRGQLQASVCYCAVWVCVCVWGVLEILAEIWGTSNSQALSHHMRESHHHREAIYISLLGGVFFARLSYWLFILERESMLVLHVVTFWQWRLYTFISLFRNMKRVCVDVCGLVLPLLLLRSNGPSCLASSNIYFCKQSDNNSEYY